MKKIKLLKCGHFSTFRMKNGYEVCNKCNARDLYFYRYPERKPVASFELNYAAWLNKRIDQAETLNLSTDYIDALKDARKIFLSHNPLLELVI